MTQPLDILATIFFALAVLHTFCVKRFQHWAGRYPQDSAPHEVLELLGEVEVVFGLWAALFVLVRMFWEGFEPAAHFVESSSFTEPAFVFVVMAVASTLPVVSFARACILAIARLLPLPAPVAFTAAALTVGPLCGSLITEPAAMTVTAILLKERLFDRNLSERTKYALLAVLFVNVSIGGVLTHFAAPPVLMVAPIWGWGTAHLFGHFGWKAMIAVVCNVALLVAINFRELSRVESEASVGETKATPTWVIALHLAFLVAIVLTQHHPAFFAGAFLFFLGVVKVTLEHQETLRLRESLLVGFFLAGLVVLGGPQRWWLEPILHHLGALPLFLSTTGLTAVLDNAALTYLGAQVPGISESMKYALVAGAVCGGGLTVIANAPNPAGFAILNPSFGREGITPFKLLGYALLPTLVAMAAFWLL